MLIAAIASGQVVSRIDRYRFVSAGSLAVFAFGLYLLAQVTPASSEGEVVRDLVVVGLGFGGNQPIYQNAVMSAVPHRFVGVASAQTQFWRVLGQTVGVTVLGAVLAAQLGGVGGGEESLVAPAAGTSPEALRDGLRLVFLVATACAVLAVVFALTPREVPLRGRAPRRIAAAELATDAAVLGE
jgi:MFS family permease